MGSLQTFLQNGFNVIQFPVQHIHFLLLNLLMFLHKILYIAICLHLVNVCISMLPGSLDETLPKTKYIPMSNCNSKET